uniref:Uncharacterized protein n=1 Tax=Arundo donax TaxID=35708 RepID=A0A0A8ZWU1_ARUDO
MQVLAIHIMRRLFYHFIRFFYNSALPICQCYSNVLLCCLFLWLNTFCS